MSNPHHSGHGSSGHGHSGGGHHTHNAHYNHNHNVTHQCGNVYRGRRYGHCCFRNGWCGWSHSRWCNRLGCWLYWCVPQGCWYQFCDGTCYCPLDDQCDENCDD